MSKARKIKVIYSKLGRTNAWGWAHCNYIEIDERLKGKKYLEILSHECLHFLFPALSEEEIEAKSILLTNTLWAEGIRRVDNSEKGRLQDGSK